MVKFRVWLWLKNHNQKKAKVGVKPRVRIRVKGNSEAKNQNLLLRKNRRKKNQYNRVKIRGYGWVLCEIKIMESIITIDRWRGTTSVRHCIYLYVCIRILNGVIVHPKSILYISISKVIHNTHFFNLEAQENKHTQHIALNCKIISVTWLLLMPVLASPCLHV